MFWYTRDVERSAADAATELAMVKQREQDLMMEVGARPVLSFPQPGVPCLVPPQPGVGVPLLRLAAWSRHSLLARGQSAPRPSTEPFAVPCKVVHVSHVHPC